MGHPHFVMGKKKQSVEKAGPPARWAGPPADWKGSLQTGYSSATISARPALVQTPETGRRSVMFTHANSDNQQSGMQAYWLSIFLGAFLLFAVQLVLGKYFLPWFGGTPAMWTTCMFFFQTLLLAGYAYAHGLASRLSARAQSIAHSTVLLLSLLLLGWRAVVWRSPLTPDIGWRPYSSDHPVWHLIVLLLASAGLPYFVLS